MLKHGFTFLIFFCVTGVNLYGSIWPIRNADLGRTGSGKISAPETGCIKWVFNTPSPIPGGIVINSQDQIYLPSEDGWIYVLDQQGIQVDIVDANSTVWGCPTIGPDDSFCWANEDGLIVMMDSTGNPQWSYQIESPNNSSPLVTEDGSVYISSYEGSLYAFDRSGNLRWKQVGDPNEYHPILASPSIFIQETIYYGRLNDPNLYARSALDGHLVWSCTLYEDQENPDLFEIGTSPVVATDGTIYASVFRKPALYAVDPNEGQILWEADLDTGQSRAFAWTEPVIGPDGTIYIALNDSTIHAVSPEGVVLWSKSLGVVNAISLTVDGRGYVYAACLEGILIVLDSTGQKVSQFEGISELYFPVIGGDGTLYITDWIGTLWAITDLDCAGQEISLHWTGDLDLNGQVNLKDYELLASKWMQSMSGSAVSRVDINTDEVVDTEDLIYFSKDWLKHEQKENLN